MMSCTFVRYVSSDGYLQVEPLYRDAYCHICVQWADEKKPILTYVCVRQHFFPILFKDLARSD
jgi:hypothetical protein